MALSGFGVPRKTKLALLSALGRITMLDSNHRGGYFELVRKKTGAIFRLKLHKNNGQTFLVRKISNNFKAIRIK